MSDQIRDELDRRREHVRPDLHTHHEVYQGFQQALAALMEIESGMKDEPDIGINVGELMDIAGEGMDTTVDDAAERVEELPEPKF